jgi:hypothetical protein
MIGRLALGLSILAVLLAGVALAKHELNAPSSVAAERR